MADNCTLHPRSTHIDVGDAEAKRVSKGSALASTLLEEYGSHLNPMESRIPRLDALNDVEQPAEPSKFKLLSPGAETPPKSITPLTMQMSSRSQSVLSPTSLGSHRSMLRTLASRTSQESLRKDRVKQESASSPRDTFASRFFHTPCFFHQRFEEAVNVDRVLEEIAADDVDGISHTRLMQTATSVREISKQLQRRPIKRDVKSVMIVTKARDNSLVHLTREITQWLLETPRYGSEHGVIVYVDAKLRNARRFDSASLLSSSERYSAMLRYWTPDMCIKSPEKFDLVLTLGGDGTVLYTSWLFQRIVPPILSFSLGTLGFLTNFSYDDYRPTLDRIMEGSGMRVNMRMRFTCTVYRAPRRQSRTSSRTSSMMPTSEGSMESVSLTGMANTPSSLTTSTTPISPHAPSSLSSAFSTTRHTDSRLVPEVTFEVLNELVLDRGPSPYVSNLELYGDSHLLTIVQADGIIISTPTGSTAYSLSAGGPLTHPSIPGILLTPICPHTLSFRPMVLSDTLLLRLVVPKHSRGGAYASFDGKGRVELRRGDEVRVEVGRYPFPTVVGEGGTGGEWFDSVRRALRWNTRGAVQGGFSSRVNAGIDELITKEEHPGTASDRYRYDKEDHHYASNTSTPCGSVNGPTPLTMPRHRHAPDDNDSNNKSSSSSTDGSDEDEESWDIDTDPIATENNLASSYDSVEIKTQAKTGGEAVEREWGLD